jgi:membrane associated rhomboid family serine protease
MSNMQEMRIVFPSPDKLLTPGVVLVLLLSVLGYVGVIVAQDTVFGFLALNPRAVVHGMIWQLVTYPFVNLDPWNLVWNGLVILFIGSAIEREWRTPSFLWLWLTVCVCCGVLWVLIGVLFPGRAPLGMGANACGYGLIATFGMLFRGRRYLVYFGVLEAQHIALGLIAIGFLLGLRAPITLIWVAGALVAYVYSKAHWSMHTGTFRPAGRRQSGGSSKGQFVDID